MSETQVFVFTRLTDTNAPGAYIVDGVELKRFGNDTDGDKEDVAVQIKAKRSDESTYTIDVHTVGLYVQGGPHKPDDDTVKAFLQQHNVAELPEVRVGFEGAQLLNAHRIQWLPAARRVDLPPRRVDPMFQNRLSASYSSKSKRRRRRSARSDSSSQASETDADSSEVSDSSYDTKVYYWH